MSSVLAATTAEDTPKRKSRDGPAGDPGAILATTVRDAPTGRIDTVHARDRSARGPARLAART
jgi:hypothetical protein